jgi:hypothetical protein
MDIRLDAILCANNQRGIDVLIPVVYRDAELGHLNITVIIVQVKNDKTFTAAPKEPFCQYESVLSAHIRQG